MFPERLGRAIVYPVPYTLSWIWTAAKCCIDPETRKKIVLLTGPARVASPPPTEQLLDYLEPEVEFLIEFERRSGFKSSTASVGAGGPGR